MIHIDEKYYFYLLFIIPILGVFFVFMLLWRNKTQRIFAKTKSFKISARAFFFQVLG